jgi:glutamate/aspartate transport system substrate-binding protein
MRERERGRVAAVSAYRRRSLLRALVLACALVTAAGPSAAQYVDEHGARPLTGVLKRIKDAGVVRIGYRQAAIPFSFEGPEGRPYGYSVDLCHGIVDDIAEAAGIAMLVVQYRLVTPADRIDQVADGRVDLECGATTNTAERRKRVAFSPLIFVAGTRLLVRHGSPVRSARDLPGRKVAVVRGTTNEEAMRHLSTTIARGVAVLVADDYPQALQMLADGQADAFAADDILLTAHVAEKGLRGQYAVVGELLSYEPYGIVFARDDAPLAAAVDAALRRLASSRELRWIYNKWFLRPLPSGIRLGLPMGVELQRSFEILGLPPE